MFINIRLKHVYGIDMFWLYVDKNSFYKHIGGMLETSHLYLYSVGCDLTSL